MAIDPDRIEAIVVRPNSNPDLWEEGIFFDILLKLSLRTKLSCIASLRVRPDGLYVIYPYRVSCLDKPILKERRLSEDAMESLLVDDNNMVSMSDTLVKAVNEFVKQFCTQAEPMDHSSTLLS